MKLLQDRRRGCRYSVAADPLPVVLFHRHCEWRDGVIDPLAAAGRQWRAALESSSLSAVEAAIGAGVGVGALLPQTVPAGMTVPVSSALPSAPSVELALYRRQAVGQPAALTRLESLLWQTFE